MNRAGLRHERKADRSFGLLIAAVLWAIGLYRWVKFGEAPWWLVVTGSALLAVALLTPGWLTPARRIWMKFAAVLGAMNARILMTLVFWLLIAPVGLMLRVLGKAPLQVGKRPADSYWHQRRPEEFTPARMERQF